MNQYIYIFIVVFVVVFLINVVFCDKENFAPFLGDKNNFFYLKDPHTNRFIGSGFNNNLCLVCDKLYADLYHFDNCNKDNNVCNIRVYNNTLYWSTVDHQLYNRIYVNYSSVPDEINILRDDNNPKLVYISNESGKYLADDGSGYLQFISQTPKAYLIQFP